MSHKKASAPLIAPDSRNSINKKALGMYPRASNWVQGLDLNQRPSGYEPDVRVLKNNGLRGVLANYVGNYGIGLFSGPR